MNIHAHKSKSIKKIYRKKTLLCVKRKIIYTMKFNFASILFNWFVLISTEMMKRSVEAFTAIKKEKKKKKKTSVAQ